MNTIYKVRDLLRDKSTHKLLDKRSIFCSSLEKANELASGIAQSTIEISDGKCVRKDKALPCFGYGTWIVEFPSSYKCPLPSGFSDNYTGKGMYREINVSPVDVW